MITVKDLYKDFGANSEIKVLKGVNEHIEKGEKVVIIGPSGSGKSTFLRCLNRLEEPTSGEIYFEDQLITSPKCNIDKLRMKMGMVFQHFNLFPHLSIMDNITLAPIKLLKKNKEEARENAMKLLARVGLPDKADAFPGQLSGGQKQRIAIARALACEPSILFCDEATSALDPQTTRSILALIKEIQKKMNLTVVMITHQMEVVRDACDRVAVLENGKVVEEGMVSDIFASPKSAVTKDFLSNLTNVKESIVKLSDVEGHYTLRFSSSTTSEPIISLVTKETGALFNIVAAGVQYIEDKKYGVMVLDIGPDEEIEKKAVDMLRRNGVSVERTVLGEEKQ